MKANLSNLAQVLAAQRRAAQPVSTRKNSAARSDSAVPAPGASAAKN